MSTPAAIARRIFTAPFGSDTESRTFVADTSDDSISLAPGAYEVFNAGSVTAWLRIGAAVSIPADKDPAEVGQFFVPAGGSATFVADASGDGEVHGLTASSSATLYLLRKPL